MTGKEIVKDSLVIDCLYHTFFKDPPKGDKMMLDVFLEGGLNTVSVSVVIDDYCPNTLTSIVQELYQFYTLQDGFPDKVKLIESVKDIDDAKRDGKLGIILSTQGAACLEADQRYVTILYKLGVRIMQICYNTKNNIGCGQQEPVDTGVTRFGQQVIWEMNRLGMIVDLSHVGYKTTMDAMELSKDPCIFSHVGIRKFNPNIRNIQDDQIKACAAKGGVIGLCPHSIMNWQTKGEWPTVDQYVDQILYVMDLVGEDHAGVGTDRWMMPTMQFAMTRNCFERTNPGFFGGYSMTQKHVNGFQYYDQWDNLADTLLRRGLTDEQTKKVLGGNFRRVFEQVWK